jgi:hypothetical protein
MLTNTTSVNIYNLFHISWRDGLYLLTNTVFVNKDNLFRLK